MIALLADCSSFRFPNNCRYLLMMVFRKKNTCLEASGEMLKWSNQRLHKATFNKQLFLSCFRSKCTLKAIMR